MQGHSANEQTAKFSELLAFWSPCQVSEDRVRLLHASQAREQTFDAAQHREAVADVGWQLWTISHLSLLSVVQLQQTQPEWQIPGLSSTARLPPTVSSQQVLLRLAEIVHHTKTVLRMTEKAWSSLLVCLRGSLLSSQLCWLLAGLLAWASVTLLLQSAKKHSSREYAVRTHS